MDHHGLLTTAARIQDCLTRAKQSPPKWYWQWTTLVFPESRCCFCGSPMRSPYLWCLDVRKRRLIGVVRVQKGRLTEPARIGHPHMLDNQGTLCIGRNLDVIGLISSPINRADMPHWTDLPSWLQMYWNHLCPTGQTPIVEGEEDEG